MKFRKERTNDYLFDTSVENIYISEYMAAAPGDYVKVYLYALMRSEMGQDVSISFLSKQLMLSSEEIEKAWKYWEKLGVVRLSSGSSKGGRLQVELLSLKEAYFGRGAGEADSPVRDRDLADMYKLIEKAIGRPLGGQEPALILSWITDFSAEPEIIVYAYNYCIENYSKDSANYVGKVVKDWITKGLTDVVKIDEYLEETEKNRFLQKRVFKALGFNRNPTEEEKRIMNSWFGAMGFSIDKVLSACEKTSGISSPNINYINKILTEWNKNQGGPAADGTLSAGIVLKYYDYLAEEREREAKKRREEIYEKLPEIKEIDEEIRKAGMETSRLMISDRGDKREAISRLKERVDSIMANKAAILTENSYPVDYMDIKYKCSICKDTGKTETGEKCVCFEQRMNEAVTWQNSLRK